MDFVGWLDTRGIPWPGDFRVWTTATFSHLTLSNGGISLIVPAEITLNHIELPALAGNAFGGLERDYVATIAWGDGNTSSGQVLGSHGTLWVAGNHLALQESPPPTHGHSVCGCLCRSRQTQVEATVVGLAVAALLPLLGSLGLVHLGLPGYRPQAALQGNDLGQASGGARIVSAGLGGVWGVRETNFHK